MPTKILLTEDHAAIRQGLKLLLADHFSQAVFGEAGSSQEALSLMSSEPWDATVLDVTLPGASGLEVLKEMKRLWPETPVLILSGRPDDRLAVRMLKAGASGFLTKESAVDELVGAIEQVVHGGRYVSRSLAKRMASYLDVGVQRAPHERLSEPELRVVRMLASDKTLSQIARELSQSVRIIRTYRAGVLAKMGLKNTAELKRYVVEKKLV